MTERERQEMNYGSSSKLEATSHKIKKTGSEDTFGRPSSKLNILLIIMALTLSLPALALCLVFIVFQSLNHNVPNTDNEVVLLHFLLYLK